MLIWDLERNTGLDRATIRFFEKEGMIRRSAAKTVAGSILNRIRTRF